MNNDNRIDEIYQTWDRLAEFGSSRAIEALDFLLAQLCQITNSQEAYWLGALRVRANDPSDPFNGWRPRMIHHLHKKVEIEAYSRRRINEIETAPIDPSIQAHTRLAGKFRAHRMRELVDDEWLQSEYYRELQAVSGSVDIIYIVMPINEDMESYFQVERTGDSPLYCEATRDTAAYLVRGIKWFNIELALSFGLQISQEPLQPAERRVLHMLLTDKSEKAIAAELNITTNTVHSYVTNIYRKFQVSSRSGLTALWLGKAVATV
ncbi:helix-turn-helix transcriptional regulator [Gilvimarinus agarilyticus]|uniref:helix-turn-helix transcriptional regulator n=1 Tax=Gilvimarinus agarilyticus TaxID=679259 RepID=UPI0005A009BD|nr:helix-turn-helix transcriptional regulator [Gilvimarinus agarilyticus]